MKVYCVILCIFVLFFSGRSQDTIPEKRVPLIAKQLTDKQVDSIVKSHKQQWYKKDRTWFYELRTHIDSLNANDIRRGNDIKRLIMEMDSTHMANNDLTQEKLNLILSNQRLRAEKRRLEHSVYLLTAAPHVAMVFGGSFAGCLVAMGVYRAFLNRKRNKECGKLQKNG